MRVVVPALSALCLCACTNVDVLRDADGGGYTLTVPTDVFASRPMLWRYAAEKSGKLCPYGWKLVSADDYASDVYWRVRCTAKPGTVVAPFPQSATQS